MAKHQKPIPVFIFKRSNTHDFGMNGRAKQSMIKKNRIRREEEGEKRIDTKRNDYTEPNNRRKVIII